MKKLSIIFVQIMVILVMSVSITGCRHDSKLNLPSQNDSEAIEDAQLPSTDLGITDETSDTDWSNGGGNQEHKAATLQQIVIPFQMQNGVKYVPVKVNGVGFDMILDTGCAITLISMAEANYLYQKGLLTEDDIIGSSQSLIADGRIVENMVINLKEVVLNDQIVFNNVTATVSDNVRAPLLLGNEILDRVSSVNINNEEQLLILEVRTM